LQESSTAVRQLAYTTLPKDHITRDAGRVFADGIEHPTIKIQLLLGGEKTVSEAIGQDLEVQAVLQTARLHIMSARTFWGSQLSPSR
jgi:hypothetical protein